MRFEIEPDVFRKMLENVLIYAEGKSLLDGENVGVFDTKKVRFFKTEANYASAVYAVYAPRFFLSYEVDEARNVTLNERLLNVVRRGFRGCQKITVREEGELLVLEGGGYRYAEPLEEGEPMEIPEGLKMKYDAEVGTIPEMDEEPVLQVLLTPDAIKDFPLGDVVKLACDGERIYTSVSEVGTYESPVVPKKKKIVKEMESYFERSYLERIASQFDGEFWLTIVKRGDSGLAVFSKKAKNYVLTYLLAEAIPP